MEKGPYGIFFSFLLIHYKLYSCFLSMKSAVGSYFFANLLLLLFDAPLLSHLFAFSVKRLPLIK